jgi:hypothetical protein
MSVRGDSPGEHNTLCFADVHDVLVVFGADTLRTDGRRRTALNDLCGCRSCPTSSNSAIPTDICFKPRIVLAWQDSQRRSTATQSHRHFRGHRFSDGIQPSSEVFASHIRPVCAALPNKSALLPVQPGLERY